jgi:hypothetical protein
MSMMVQSLLLLLAFRQGTCDFGSNSLIQTSRHRIGGISQGEQYEGESNSHVALANANSFITDLAQKVAGHNYTITPSERTALNVIRTFITNLALSMKKQFAEDQVLVDSARDGIENCGVQTVSRYDTAVARLHTAVLGAEKSHADCRDKEEDKLDIKDGKCGVYHNYRRSGDGIPPVCLTSLTASDVAAAVGTQKKLDMEKCLVDSKEWLDPLYFKYMECKTATEIHDGVRTNECNPLQDTFERDFCTYELKLEDSCSEQDTCRLNMVTARNGTHDSIAVEEAARKADWKTSKYIECFFDIFDQTDNEQKPGMLKQCQELSTDVSEITIAYHDIPAPASCTTEPDQPCDAPWTTNRYEGKSWSSRAPAAACKACTPRLVR